MTKKNLLAKTALPLMALSSGLMLYGIAAAASFQDRHGNTGYDSAAECDAAVQNGTAKFYQPVTSHKPLRQKGEKSVKTSKISDLGPQYSLGACDVGVGKKHGREGVDRKLQGKYIPFSPSMPINAYMNASGQVVRTSMQACDNRFSAALPRPVTAPAPRPVVVEVKPVAVVAPVVVAPVVVAPPRPAPAPVVQPVVAPVPVKMSMGPYVFGALGAQKDAICHVDGTAANLLVGQVGAGMNFNEYLGAEVFAQATQSHTYNENTIRATTSKTTAVGARLTAGTNINSQTRIFAKLGAASVHHAFGDDSRTEVRPVAGVGVTYDLTPQLSLRGDVDVSFTRLKDQAHPYWGKDKSASIGLQFKF